MKRKLEHSRKWKHSRRKGENRRPLLNHVILAPPPKSQHSPASNTSPFSLLPFFLLFISLPPPTPPLYSSLLVKLIWKTVHTATRFSLLVQAAWDVWTHQTGQPPTSFNIIIFITIISRVAANPNFDLLRLKRFAHLHQTRKELNYLHRLFHFVFLFKCSCHYRWICRIVVSRVVIFFVFVGF